MACKLITFNGICQSLKLRHCGVVEMLARPIRKDNEAHEETDPAAYSYHVKALLCYLKHVMYSIA